MTFKPDERQAALILLRALQERGERRQKPLTRARLSQVTMKRLWNREQLTREWLDKVNEWLLSAGWTLVHTGSTFGVVKTDVIYNWPRVASKHVASEVEEMMVDQSKFAQLEPLLIPSEPAPQKAPNVTPPRKRKAVERTS